MKEKKQRKYLLRAISWVLAAMMITCSTVPPVPAFAATDTQVDREWYNFRNNQENNGVTDRKTPITSEEAALKWAEKYGENYNASPTPPLLLNGYLYVGLGDRIYQLDKETGEALQMSSPLISNVGYAMNPLLYADGKLFVQVGNGIVQAVDLETLDVLWHTERIGGQTVSPISYTEVNGKGYIYTGTWNRESADGTYFCVSTDDSNIIDGVKQAEWSFTPSVDDPALAEEEAKYRGFYWAGAYATENYIAVGSDDGTSEGSYTKNAVFYTLDPVTGKIIDRIDQVKGDIRTTAVYDNGYLYFSTKGGHLYKVSVDSEGNLGEPSYIDLGGMTTASPVVYRNKIYIGVCGQGGQFDPDGGHGFAVVNNGTASLSQDSLMYTIPIKGYPQASALVSTAYTGEDFDGDGTADGRVYIYFTYNAYPGGIYYTYDTAEQSQAADISKELFVPGADRQQYCISTICADYEGTLYYKNDSGSLFAVERNPAYLKDLTLTTDDGSQVTWDQEFQPGITEYYVTVPASAEKITLTGVTADGSTSIFYDAKEIVLEEGKTIETSVIVESGGKSREYQMKIRQESNDGSLAELKVSRSNTYDALLLALSPEFDAGKTEYKVDVTQYSDNFYRLWPTSADYADMEVTASDNVQKITTGKSGTRTRYNIYPADTAKTASVDVKVTSEDGTATQTYRVSLMKKYYFASAETAVQEFNGTAVEPEICVYNGMGEVIDPSQYTVAYENNTAPGTATAVITGAENSSYAGSEITVEFDIVEKELAAVQVEEQLYTGSEIEPEITVISKAGLVVDPSEYEVTYSNHTEVGEGHITVKAKADSGYTGELETTFVIRKQKLSVTLKDGDIYAYTGGDIKPNITVKNEKGKTVSSKYYTVTYENNVEPGTGILHVTANEDSDCGGTTSAEFQILKGEISYYSVDTQPYSGRMVFPDIVIKDNNRRVVPPSAYTMQVENNVEVGTATFTVKAKEGSGYFGELTGSFQIKKARLESAEIAVATYTGNEVIPDITVKDEFGRTVPKESYDIVCLNNTNVGNATVIITAKGESIYRGILCTNFIIQHGIIDEVKVSTDEYIYDGTKKEPIVTVYANGRKVDSSQYTVKYTSNTNVGKAKVTVTGKKNYTGTVQASYLILPKAPATVTSKLYGYDDIQISWSKVNGASGYYVYYKKADDKNYVQLTRTTGTSVKKANLTDGVRYYFKVVPYFKSGETRYQSTQYKTANIYTLKKMPTPVLSKNGTKVKVKWTNINGETGYQISKSTSKTGTNIVATVATTTGTIKSVSATKNKTYYYKVRAYKTVDGKKIYGPWSNVKAYKRK